MVKFKFSIYIIPEKSELRVGMIFLGFRGSFRVSIRLWLEIVEKTSAKPIVVTSTAHEIKQGPRTKHKYDHQASNEPLLRFKLHLA